MRIYIHAYMHMHTCMHAYMKYRDADTDTNHILIQIIYIYINICNMQYALCTMQYATYNTNSNTYTLMCMHVYEVTHTHSLICFHFPGTHFEILVLGS